MAQQIRPGPRALSRCGLESLVTGKHSHKHMRPTMEQTWRSLRNTCYNLHGEDRHRPVTCGLLGRTRPHRAHVWLSRGESNWSRRTIRYHRLLRDAAGVLQSPWLSAPFSLLCKALSCMGSLLFPPAPHFLPFCNPPFLLEVPQQFGDLPIKQGPHTCTHRLHEHTCHSCISLISL